MFKVSSTTFSFDPSLEGVPRSLLENFPQDNFLQTKPHLRATSHHSLPSNKKLPAPLMLFYCSPSINTPYLKYIFNLTPITRKPSLVAKAVSSFSIFRDMEEYQQSVFHSDIDNLGQNNPFCGFVHSFERALEIVKEYELKTTTKFTVYKRSKDFGKAGKFAN
jgi:hypothetical protein